jgi:hypothetical protein
MSKNTNFNCWRFFRKGILNTFFFVNHKNGENSPPKKIKFKYFRKSLGASVGCSSTRAKFGDRNNKRRMSSQTKANYLGT